LGLAAEGRACGGGRWTAAGAALLASGSDLSLDRAWSSQGDTKPACAG